MKKFLFAFVCLMVMGMQDVMAQLSSNPYKFLGNITTSNNVDAGNGIPAYYTLWNQITCENESAWSVVEGTKDTFNWGPDKAFNYAQEHNFPYTFHSLVWGAQYPSWLENLSATDRLTALTNWFDKVKAKYNNLPMINVANEAVGYHQPGNPMMKETLGGAGKTGYDWLIKAFEMAYERWPDAILIYNDYNSIRWDIDNYITLVRTLRDAGAPIDAYGNEGHELSEISESELSSALKKQQDALQMPMFVTELDIDIADDTLQKAQYQKVLPLIWETPYCAGVTLWGYVLGKTWVDYSGLYSGSTERPAMTWIKEYMGTDAAKNAVGPLPGAKKEASIYIHPAALKVAKDDVLPVKVHAHLATKTIEKVDLYVNDELVKTMTEAPYITEVTSSKTGWNTTKAVVTATDGSIYERYGRFQVINTTLKRSTYNETAFQIPGTINVAEYDNGASGITYSKASRNDTTATKDDQWMEYTVDVQKDGYYTLDMEVAATNNGGTFHLSEYSLDSLTFFTDFIEVPNTGSTTDFQVLSCPMKEYLTAGRHVFCLNIDKGGFYIKKLTFKNNSAEIVTPEPYAVLTGDTISGLTVTFYYDGQKSTRGGVDINNRSVDDSYSSPYGSATKAVFDASFADYRPTSTAYWFEGCSSLTTINHIENLKTDSVTDMWGMFEGCSSLTSLDVTGFDTQNVTSMISMFGDCSSLKSLDVSGFNTQNVAFMNGMFRSCSSLTSLDISNFNTQNVKGMDWMFAGSYNLNTICVGGSWTTDVVTSSNYMFTGCTKLVGGKGTKYDENHVDHTYAHIDGGSSNPGYFTAFQGWLEQLANGDAEKPWANPDTRWDDTANNYKICAWGKTKGRNMTEDGNGWNAFPADIEEEEGGDGNHVFVVHAANADTPNDAEGNDASAWDNQFWIQSPQAWSAGSKVRIKFRYKASKDVVANTQVHKQNPSEYLHWRAIGDISFTTDWQEFDDIMTIDSSMDGCWSIAFNLNSNEKSATDFYFDDLSWSVYQENGSDEPKDTVVVSLVNNGNMEGDDNGNFYVRLDHSKGNERPTNALITDGVGMNGSRGIKVEAGAKVLESWDNQFWVRLNQPVSEGTRFRMSFDYRADKAVDVGYEMHEEPSIYINIPTFKDYTKPFYQDWEHFEYDGEVSSTNSSDQLPFQSFTFTLNVYEGANIYYFDNFKFEVIMEDQCPKPTYKQKGNEISIYSPFNATIYYTLDGSTPTVNSAVYSAPIKLMQNAEINAIAVVEGRETSPVATYVYESSTFDSNGVLTVNGAMTLPDAIELVGGREEVGKTITAIVWNSFSIPYSSDLQEVDNPNMLVYIPSSAIAPVIKVDNVIVEGVAKSVVLTDAKEGNNNFYCPQAFTAEKVTYTRNFQQQTQVGVSRGWESIALPFTVQTVTHEKQQTIAPFGSDASTKHFWLRRLGDNGLTQATKIEANVPYIISMPNNSDAYYADYNLSGKVTFTSQDVTVPVTAPVTLAKADSTVMMVPAFQSIGRSSNVWAINVGEVRAQYLEGSVFERNYREVRPFEAYTVHNSNSPAPRFVPIKDIGGATGILTSHLSPLTSVEGVWYDLNGRKLQQKPTRKGVYILNGTKVVIK